MGPKDCLSLRSDLAAFLAGEVIVSPVDQGCVATLPIKTLDDRYIDVFVDQTVTEFAIVHDGGKSVSELYIQGIHLSDSKRDLLRRVAQRYGVTLDDRDVLKIMCRPEKVPSAILAVAQCASLAMLEVASHFPIVEEEPLSAKVKRGMDRLDPELFTVKHLVQVKGRAAGAVHRFDSLATARDNSVHTVAVKILVPSYGPQVQADRYGFMALDLRGSSADYPRVAIVSRIEEWPRYAIDMVRRLSGDTIELKTGQEQVVEREVTRVVAQLAAA